MTHRDAVIVRIFTSCIAAFAMKTESGSLKFVIDTALAHNCICGMS